MSNSDRFFREQRTRNWLQSFLLLGGMFGLFGALGGWLVGGWSGVLLLGIVGLVSATVGARVSPRMVLRLYRARPLGPREAPGLHRVLNELADRAGLERTPEPFYLPTRMINAFAVGRADRAAIGISDGMLRSLSSRELRAVLAHEITHVVNNDAWVMGLADWISRMVGLFSWIGQILLLLSIPAILLGARPPMPLGLLLLLVFAPTLSALLQLALSRSREYDADLGGARIAGDPRGLASALQKMEDLQGGFLERLLLPGRRVPEPSLLRTHPPTEERVRRLLAAERQLARETPDRRPEADLLDHLPARPESGPRWYPFRGVWR